jgi:hypothetical protein
VLSLCPRTLRRYEVEGKLTAIKINSRFTRYGLADVMRLAAGN